MAESECWRVSLGQRGCRVVLFEREPGGPLYREVYLSGKRVATKKSLSHRDRERAEADGYRLLASLKAREDALKGERLTLQTLFDIYVGSPSFGAKKEMTQRGDRAKLRLVMDFLGADREVRSLSESDVERYKQARMRGEHGTRASVGATTTRSELVALRTMLNWATRQRSALGKPLLEYNPLRGMRLPVEKNPRRPVETYDRFLGLMEVAGEVDWRLPAVLSLAESTGQRISSILRIKRGDIDLERQPHGWIRFRAENQKTGVEHSLPLTPECAALLTRHLRQVPDHPDAWLFPGERTPEHPVDGSKMSKLLRKAYARAGLKTLRGGLWHPWRRKWATERKHLPLKDVAKAGGWKDPNTLLICYQQPDEGTMTRVVLEPGKLYERGVVNASGEKLPHYLPHQGEIETPADRPALALVTS
jgi:integrase